MEHLSERGVATRRRLLEAAGAELVESGDIEVAAVARRAGLSVGLPYRYFGTRSGLMSALLADFYERLVSGTVLGHFAGRTWSERWRSQLTRWVDWVYDEPLAPVVLGRMVGDAQVAAMEADCAKQVIALGARHIAAGQDEGAVTFRRDPELMSAAVVGGMRSILAVVLDQDPRPDRATVLEEIWHFSTAALGVHEESATRHVQREDVALDVQGEGAALDVHDEDALHDVRAEGAALGARQEDTALDLHGEKGAARDMRGDGAARGVREEGALRDVRAEGVGCGDRKEGSALGAGGEPVLGVGGLSRDGRQERAGGGGCGEGAP